MKKVSILIPSLYPERLKQSIESVYRYTSDIDYEIVIVGPEKIVSIFEGEKNVRFVSELEQKGSSIALQSAIDTITGEYLVVLNDDILVTENWLSNMIKFLEKNDNGYPLCGSFRIKSPTGEELPQGYVYGKYIGRKDNFLYAQFPCIKLTTLLEIGNWNKNRGYHNHYVDPDLGMRVWNAGGRVLACPDAWIIHLIDRSEYGWKKRMDKYGSKDEKLFHKYWNNSEIFRKTIEIFTKYLYVNKCGKK